MLNGGSSAPVINFTVIDQSTGSRQYEPEVQDDGRIIMLVRDTVSADFENPNSEISKSAGQNLNVQRSR